MRGVPTDIMPKEGCPFCDRVTAGEATAMNDLAAAIPDAHPVSPGHTLVVPRRHVEDFFTLSDDEQAALLDLVRDTRNSLLAHKPDGFNVGVNIGTAAGQTVPHAHVHVIPRYEGDIEAARVGLRQVFPRRTR